MNLFKVGQRYNMAIAVLIPLLALGVQWVLWGYVKPLVWFFFFPAVFFSARIGGFKGGIASTLISTLIVWFFFIPPQLSFNIDNPYNIFSVVVFMIMGFLFSQTQSQLDTARQRIELSLQQSQAANVKINQLYQKTLELDELKNQFFANVSHELRTPLTLILGPVQKSLGEPGLDETLRRSLEVVDRNAHLLYQRVTDLLDLSRLEAGRMSLQYSQLDLAYFTRLTASNFDTIAADRQIHYLVEAPESLAVQVDIQKCQRILFNLLSNAFKFTPNGGEIQVDLKTEGDFALLQVGDSGPGIPAAMRQAVFERFRQVEGEATRKHGGTGLGLAIVKEFVELQNGRVEVQTSPTGGALFYIHLPLAAPAGVKVNQPPENLDVDGSRPFLDELYLDRGGLLPDHLTGLPEGQLVLVVEDNPDMNAFIMQALARFYRVASAFNGQEGLEKALALRPDLILADVMMPLMSGDQMFAALRSYSDVDIPLIILTARADETLRIKLLQQGVHDVLNKPFTVEELLARVGNVLAQRRLHREKYQRLVENVNDLVCEIDLQGCFTYLNPQYKKILGYEPAELLGKHASEIGHPEQRAAARQKLDELAAAGQSSREIWRFRHKNGEWRWLECSATVYEKTSGEKVVAVVSRDITQQKQAESQIAFQAALLQAVGQAVIATDLAGTITYLNQAAEELYGWPAAEAVGRNILEVTVPSTSQAQAVEIMASLTAGHAWSGEFLVQHRNGTVFPVMISDAPVLDEARKLIGIIGVSTDITRHKLDEEALHESEERLRVTLNATQIAIWDWDLKNDSWFASPQYNTMLGYEPEIGPSDRSAWLNRTHPQDRNFVADRIQQVLDGKDSNYEYEARVLHADGSYRWLRVIGHVVEYDACHHATRMVGIRMDITDRKNNEEALRASEERFHQVVDMTGEWLWEVDASGMVTFASPVVEKLLGYQVEELVGKKYYADLFTPPAWEAIKTVALQNFEREEPIRKLVTEVLSGDGRLLILETNATPILAPDGTLKGFRGTANDITERRLVEEKILQSEASLNKAQQVAHLGSWRWLIQSNRLEWSDEMYVIFGIDKTTFSGSLPDVMAAAIHPEDRPAVEASNLSVIKDKKPVPLEYRVIRQDGTVRAVWAEVGELVLDENGSPAFLTGIVQDITERKKADEKLKATLEVKETLLREVHHRVKNNLQAIIALMQMQSGQITDPDMRQFLQELEGQARTMALVYEQLYQSENLAHVAMDSYLKYLADNILDMFGSQRNITLKLEVDPLSMDVSQAMPCGLIVNELVTNTFKYAFPPDFEGQAQIEIGLHQEADTYHLKVGDNGMGLPVEMGDQASGGGLGLRLVRMWATHQLGGTLVVSRKNGTTFDITFHREES